MFFKLLSALVFFGLFSIANTYADVAPTGHGIPVITFYVKQFGDLEQKLLDETQLNKITELEALLAISFEMRNSNGEVTPRQDWIAQSTARFKNYKIDYSSLAVYESGNAAVASFKLISADGKSDRFCVDVWVPDNDNWQLRARFESKI